MLAPPPPPPSFPILPLSIDTPPIWATFPFLERNFDPPFYDFSKLFLTLCPFPSLTPSLLENLTSVDVSSQHLLAQSQQ